MLNDPPPEKRRHPLEAPPSQKPEGEEAPRQRVTLHIPVVRPIVTYTLIAVNVAIYLLAFFVVPDSTLNTLYEQGASNRIEVLRFGEYHRLFTAMFLHSGPLPLHIFFNMYALWIIGRTVEGFFGHLRFALIYFLGGLTGSLLSVLFNGPQVFSVGASGAVFAIFGAEIIYIYQHRKLLGPMAQAQLRQLIVIAGLNFFIGITSSLDPGGVNIDNWGHVGGFIGGLILTWYIGPVFIFKRHPTNPGALAADDSNPIERRVQFLAIYISALLAVLLVASILAR
jgi:rhomboid protease GluP